MKKKLKFKIPRVGRVLLFVGVGIAIIGWLVVSLVNEIERKQNTFKELASLDKTIQELKDENQKLLQKKEYLTNEENIEREARMRLNLKKQDENVVIIVPETDKGQKPLESQENHNPETDAKFFQKLWDLLF